MWWNRERRLKALEAEVESLRRAQDSTQYDLLVMKSRFQRLLWRERKAEAAGAAADTGTSPEARASAALATATPTDPLSAMLLARRRKAPLPREET